MNRSLIATGLLTVFSLGTVTFAQETNNRYVTVPIEDDRPRRFLEENPLCDDSDRYTIGPIHTPTTLQLSGENVPIRTVIDFDRLGVNDPPETEYSIRMSLKVPAIDCCGVIACEYREGFRTVHRFLLVPRRIATADNLAKLGSDVEPEQRERETVQTRQPGASDPVVVDGTEGDAQVDQPPYCWVLFPGWKMTAARYDEMVKNSEQVLEARGERHLWHIVVVDVSDVSGHHPDPDIMATIGPARAASNISLLGVEEARELTGFERYLVMGESAGAHGARLFTHSIKSRTPDAWVQTVLLDAYVPDAELGGEPFGTMADFTLNIRDTYAQGIEQNQGIGFMKDHVGWYWLPADEADTAFVLRGVTGPEFERAYNIDVSSLFPEPAESNEVDLVEIGRQQAEGVGKAGQRAAESLREEFNVLATYSKRHAWPADWLTQVIAEESSEYHQLLPIFGSWPTHDQFKRHNPSQPADADGDEEDRDAYRGSGPPKYIMRGPRIEGTKMVSPHSVEVVDQDESFDGAELFDFESEEDEDDADDLFDF